MGEIVDGPKPFRVAVNQPFERLPQCGCDSGTGMTFQQQAVRIAELEAAVLAAKVLLKPTTEATEGVWQLLNDAYHRNSAERTR